MTNETRTMLADCARDYRRTWRSLAVTDLAYKAIAFVILTPLVGLLFQGMLALSGNAVLADQDIAYFLLGPVGWITMIVVGASWIAIAALEQAALVGVLAAGAAGHTVRARGALVFAARQAWPVLKMTARIVVLALLAAAPFLAIGGLVYFWLLTEFDINYYLTEKPPEFWWAAGLIGSLLAAMTIVLIWLATCWFFALPLLLFEQVAPAEALRASRLRTAGHRRSIFFWIVGWLVAMAVLSAVATLIVGLIGNLLVPAATGSITLLAACVGAMVFLWIAGNIVVTLITATTFSAILMTLYRKCGGKEPADVAAALAEAKTDAPLFHWSRGRIAAGFVIAILLAALVGVWAIQDIEFEDHALIIAHRAGAAKAPENTMAAVRQAIADEADYIEIDVQESADGVVLVVHDSDLKKLAGSNLKIHKATAEQLQAVDIGSRFSPKFAGERVPTLDEVLQACKGKIKLMIELKYYGRQQKLEQRVIDLVEAHDMASDVEIMSLKYEGVKKVRKLRPKWRVGLLSAVAVGDLTKLDVDFYAVNLKLATHSFIRTAHGKDKDVYVWTINDPWTMSDMAGNGVDGLITDDPAVARWVLEERAGLSPIERLLLELAVLFDVSPEEASAADDA